MTQESVSGKLSELNVCNIKDELEKRELEINGNENVLEEPLQKTLRDNRHDTELCEEENNATKIKVEDDTMKNENGENSGVVVDEVGTIDHEDFDERINNDTNTENEESINLTIEEDEQKLLNDESFDEKDRNKTEDDEKTKKGKSEQEEEDKEEDSVGKIKVNEEIKETKEEKVIWDKKKDKNDQNTSKKSTTIKNGKHKSSAIEAGLKSSSSRNLWVAGLSSTTRASDLKAIFSEYGKVIGAKVVTNTRTPGTKCYGYITMASSTDASICIEKFNQTELHGQIISVERTKNEICGDELLLKKDEKKNSQSRDRTTSESENKENDKKLKDKKEEYEAKKDDILQKAKRELSYHETRKRSHSANPGRVNCRDCEQGQECQRKREREQRRNRENFSFLQIREEHERQRLREKERQYLHEKERQLREEEKRRRVIKRWQREEEGRLAVEREKLKLERGRLEREKAELLRLERERQKLERENVELDRLELKRQQVKIIQTSRIEEPKRSLKRSSGDRYSEYTDRKRITSERKFEPPPPPRFDSPIATYDRSSDKKRDDYSSSKREIDVPRHSSNYHCSRADTSSHKSKRYLEPDRTDQPDLRSSDLRRNDARDSARNSSGKRYEEVSSYVDRQSSGGGSSVSQWHSHNSTLPVLKSFISTTMQSNSNVPNWHSKLLNDRWRSAESSQDRYDRTYNERSGTYIDSSRQSGIFLGRTQNRYSEEISRYENGKY